MAFTKPTHVQLFYLVLLMQQVTLITRFTELSQHITSLTFALLTSST